MTDQLQSNRVYLCYMTQAKKSKLVKIVDSFDKAKTWQREMNKITRELTRLRGKYEVYLATHKHKVTKGGRVHNTFSKSSNEYYDFRREHNLDGTETMSSAYFHDWEVETQ